MDKLRQFYQDKEMVGQVHQAITGSLYQLAGDKAFRREKTEHIADAKEAVDTFFRALAKQYDPPKDKEVENPE